MKRIIAWISLTLGLVVLAVFLFISGKEHKVFIENKKIDGIKPLKSVVYVVDDQKKVKIKARKKKVAMLKGTSHKMVLTFKKDGKEVTLEKDFKLKVNGEVVISVPKIIEGRDGWLIYKTPKSKQKS